jgi:hypothetical protein
MPAASIHNFIPTDYIFAKFLDRTALGAPIAREPYSSNANTLIPVRRAIFTKIQP